MSLNEIFKQQLADGATDTFSYCIEIPGIEFQPSSLEYNTYTGTLNDFPANLKFVRMYTESIPIFLTQ